MSEGTESAEENKWDELFKSTEFILGTNPSPYLETNIESIELIIPGRKALDIACGEGRNSIFLAMRRFTVTGLDRSEAGLQKAKNWMEREELEIDFRIANLEGYEFTETYDLIINFNFLLRELIPKAVGALNKKGVLIIDTLLNSPFVPTTHKTEFLLRPDELYTMFSGFPGDILSYDERLHDQVPTSKLIFQKSA